MKKLLLLTILFFVGCVTYVDYNGISHNIKEKLFIVIEYDRDEVDKSLFYLCTVQGGYEGIIAIKKEKSREFKKISDRYGYTKWEVVDESAGCGKIDGLLSTLYEVRFFKDDNLNNQ